MSQLTLIAGVIIGAAIVTLLAIPAVLVAYRAGYRDGRITAFLDDDKTAVLPKQRRPR